jgi:catechol 2,3-dioxygenase-like lactoylglutathione lyase family enzyme
MVTFAGIDHLSLSVTDLDRSQRFYTDVLDFVPVMDFGYARSLFHRRTRFFLALVRHEKGSSEPYSELNTGLDHVGLAAADLDELIAWEQRFEAHGVVYTPIREMEFGHHLNFRDPDNIPLEFSISNPTMLGWMDELAEREFTPEEIQARVAEYLGQLAVPNDRR